VGGIFLADRSRILTRKVMKIAISTSGVSRLQSVLKVDQLGGVGVLGRRVALSAGASALSRPAQQQQPYILNLQGGPVGSGGGGTVAVSRGITIGGGGGLSISGGGGRVGTLQIATSGIQSTGGSHFVVQDAFKTDIQDFKGGIKFELGRNIHQILPQTDLG
jgi:hypothetical protein